MRTDTESPPGQLTILLDASRSMATADEVDSTKRFDRAVGHLKSIKPLLDRLKKEFNVETRLYRFADNPNSPQNNSLSVIRGLGFATELSARSVKPRRAYSPHGRMAGMRWLTFPKRCGLFRV